VTQTASVNHHLKENIMASIQPSPLLKFAFSADAAVSLAVAAVQLLWLDGLGRLLVLPPALLAESGLFLVGYALLLAVLARSRAVARPLVLLLIIGNAGWAAGCALAAALTGANALGLGFLALQAVTVLLFAGLQLAGLKASAAAAARTSALQAT
jgi:hypothetical protein